MSRGRQSNYWCWTYNNPSVVEYDLPRTWSDVQYCIWQSEVGESGTEHLQGYVVFKSQHRLSYLRNMLVERGYEGTEVHWEARRGTHAQAKDYCRKLDNPVEGPWEIGDDSGVPATKGQRSDLEALRADLKSGKPLDEIADDHFGDFIRYHRGILAYKALQIKPKEKRQPVVHVFWGPTGTGKSRRADEMYPGAYRVSAPNQKNGSFWWLGYQGEEEVIFDDFYGWIKYDELLRVLDWYPMRVQDKGTSVNLRAWKFVFTSNKHPSEWYPNLKDTTALNRRLEQFGSVEEMNQNWDVNFNVEDDASNANSMDAFSQ